MGAHLKYMSIFNFITNKQNSQYIGSRKNGFLLFELMIGLVVLSATIALYFTNVNHMFEHYYENQQYLNVIAAVCSHNERNQEDKQLNSNRIVNLENGITLHYSYQNDRIYDIYS